MPEAKVCLYLANSFGFASLTREDVVEKDILPELVKIGYEVFEPFLAGETRGAFEPAVAEQHDYQRKHALYAEAVSDTYDLNISLMERSDVLAALLDGPLDIDSGVAYELGHWVKSGRGPLVALRTDFRNVENIAAKVNIMPQQGVMRAGRFCTTKPEFFAELRRLYRSIRKAKSSRE
jgi:nucleoside 2-deoxyribosyltransferase